MRLGIRSWANFAERKGHPRSLVHDVAETLDAHFDPKGDRGGWEVIVGNVGMVIGPTDAFTAALWFLTYVGYSRDFAGRCAGESVTLVCRGEPVQEYCPPPEMGDE